MAKWQLSSQLCIPATLHVCMHRTHGEMAVEQPVMYSCNTPRLTQEMLLAPAQVLLNAWGNLSTLQPHLYTHA